jgi:hypothetical protein
MTAAIPATSSRTIRIWMVVLIALALLSFLAMRRSLGKAMRMNSETTAASALPQIKPGEEVKVVVEVTAVAPGASVAGNTLEKQTETVYRRTGSATKIGYDDATPIVMGKAADVHEGAVLHITAKMGDDHVLHATQIVVLTGYVKVQ